VTRIAGLAIVAMFCLGCGSSNSSAGATPAAVSTPEPTPDCKAAPAWLKDAIQGTIRPKGAKLGKTNIAPARNLDGPGIIMSSKFAKAWFVGSRINGGGVDDEKAVWLTNSLKEGDGLIFGVSAAARRYSDLGADLNGDITGDGEGDVRACLGPA